MVTWYYRGVLVVGIIFVMILNLFLSKTFAGEKIVIELQNLCLKNGQIIRFPQPIKQFWICIFLLVQGPLFPDKNLHPHSIGLILLSYP